MDEFSSDIPNDVSKLLSDLDVLKGIPVGHKFNVITNTYSSTWSVWDRGIRYRTGETGNRSIDYINHILDRAIEMCRRYSKYSKTIVSAVASLEQSMMNLHNSYQGQPIIQGDISVIQMRIIPQAFENAIKTV